MFFAMAILKENQICPSYWMTDQNLVNISSSSILLKYNQRIGWIVLSFTVQSSIYFLFYRHYAGDVVYSITGFLDKNKDTLFQDFKRLLYNSSNDTIKGMWPDGAMDVTKVNKKKSIRS